jgi:hypothetical protein
MFHLLEQQDVMITDDRSLIACDAIHPTSLMQLALEAVRPLET